MTAQTAPSGEPTTSLGARLRSLLPAERWGALGFPGRWVGGAAMVLGPVLMLAGALLRARVHFFYPDQLAAVQERPVLMSTAYGLFAAGNVLLWPAVVTLASRIGERRPGWALWGGVLAVFGLFARAFHAGVDHLAFQVVHAEGADAATAIVSSGYGAFHVFSVLNLAILAGWTVLAVGAWRAGVLRPWRAVALGLAAALPLGVLKGTTPLSVVALVGLCAALVPLGLSLLRSRPRPRPATALRWIAVTALVVGALTLLGQAG
ncbi:hypothetical protein AAG589_13300 [Isoptericola sp. F-RaC21]|uniref:hypothetical protein n=1 Tax=Isoptericola sp. F-RaC21 TaxID=3141452 RepID=UPI00315B9F1E